MTPVMSFWPSIYEKISSQIKLIEYRRRFPKNCELAYMYISKPVKAICGIVYFGNLHNLNDWKREYSNNPSIVKKIDSYLPSYQYAMEIKAFQKIKPITLEELQQNVKGFTAPQSYLLLENNAVLASYIQKNTVFIGDKIKNNLNNIFPEHICKVY